ncbi:MAG: response regulator, partial [Candidatus Omnitrophica bacterium]|nr:response regulator [Candidatus Omnitrophota bacterium]
MKKRVLIVDDDKELCQEMTEILQEEGYLVDQEHDGIRGKSLAETNNYDIVLLDVKIPEITGLEILKALKKKRIASRVVIITGSFKVNKLLKNEDDPADEEIACLKLADGLVSKPFNPETV